MCMGGGGGQARYETEAERDARLGGQAAAQAVAVGAVVNTNSAAFKQQQLLAGGGDAGGSPSRGLGVDGNQGNAPDPNSAGANSATGGPLV